jgi:hypothetical protein
LKSNVTEKTSGQVSYLNAQVDRNTVTLNHQIDGRKKQDLDLNLESMKNLVDTTVSSEKDMLTRQCDDRTSELQSISSDVLSAAQTQHDGRRKIGLDQELNSMLRLTDTSLKQINSHLKVSCDLRSKDMNNIVESLSTSMSDQIDGRKKQDLDLNLESMKNLVDTTVSSEKDMLTRQCNDRTSELQSISSDVLSAAQTQHDGRRKTELDQQLNSMLHLVNKSMCEEQSRLDEQVMLYNNHGCLFVLYVHE